MYETLAQPRYDINQFLRDVARRVLETDSHAKGKLRRFIREARATAHAMLAARHP